MKLLKTIRDSDVGGLLEAPAQYKEREASRAAVFDNDKKIALLHATKKDYHKLPGGGIEDGENIEQALRREVREEIGCEIENLRELGMIEEFRNEFSLHQISYCFVVDVSGEKGAPNLQPGEEIDDGFVTVWLDIAEAIETLEREAHIQQYEGKFIRIRDLTFLKEASN